jgi:signal transduction histidine kinase
MAERRRVPITIKLPVLIGGLLVVVIAIYSWAAYKAVQRSSAALATQRLVAVTNQLAAVLHESRNQLIKAVRQVADTAAIRAYAAQPSVRFRANALAALWPPAARAQQLEAAELWSADGHRLLDAGNAARWASASITSQLLRALTPTDSGVVGPFHAVGDSLVYPVAVPIVAAGRVRGYVVQWRHLASSAQSREQTNQLIGANSHLYIGNRTGDVWSDLSLRAPPPPVDISDTTNLLRYARAGAAAVVAAARPIAQTPWVVLVEFPTDALLIPARLFLRQSLLIGAGILVLGLFSAWALSRTLTTPLAQLTHAAETIAAGDYRQPVGLEPRADELGRLAGAFDTMVARVRESQLLLEDRVRARTAELQERNEELEAFGYSISHDLRAPLRAMEGFSQALLEDYGDRLDATGREYAERVVTATRRMDQLIRDLLAYSRVTRSDVRLGRLDLGRLVRMAVEQLDAEVRSRQARIEIEPPLPPVVGHEATLAQVIANLLANGMKFVPPERSPTIRVRAERRDGFVRCWIEDNGIGIAPEHHERVFRIFERLHRTEDYPGTGIGLAIVRKGVERMGGRVGLDSTVGAGSRFWVELPGVEAVDGLEPRDHTAG